MHGQEHCHEEAPVCGRKDCADDSLAAGGACTVLLVSHTGVQGRVDREPHEQDAAGEHSEKREGIEERNESPGTAALPPAQLPSVEHAQGHRRPQQKETRPTYDSQP